MTKTLKPTFEKAKNLILLDQRCVLEFPPVNMFKASVAQLYNARFTFVLLGHRLKIQTGSDKSCLESVTIISDFIINNPFLGLIITWNWLSTCGFINHNIYYINCMKTSSLIIVSKKAILNHSHPSLTPIHICLKIPRTLKMRSASPM